MAHHLRLTPEIAALSKEIFCGKNHILAREDNRRLQHPNVTAISLLRRIRIDVPFEDRFRLKLRRLLAKLGSATKMQHVTIVIG